jgi:hypothetical protein
MPGYRLYTIKPDGHIAGPPATIDCEDDQAALKYAKQFLNGQPIEIWKLDRRVACLGQSHD